MSAQAANGTLPPFRVRKPFGCSLRPSPVALSTFSEGLFHRMWEIYKDSQWRLQKAHSIRCSADYFQVSPGGTGHHPDTAKVFSLTNHFICVSLRQLHSKGRFCERTLINFLVQCDLMNNTCRSHSDLLPSEAHAGDKERFTGTDYIYLGGHKLRRIPVLVKLWKLFILGEFLLGDVDVSKTCAALSIKTSSVKKNILDSARRNPAVSNCVSGCFLHTL